MCRGESHSRVLSMLTAGVGRATHINRARAVSKCKSVGEKAISSAWRRWGILDQAEETMFTKQGPGTHWWRTTAYAAGGGNGTGSELARVHLKVISVWKMEEFGFNEKSLKTFRGISADNRIWRERWVKTARQGKSEWERLETMLPVSMLVCSWARGKGSRMACSLCSYSTFVVCLLPLVTLEFCRTQSWSWIKSCKSASMSRSIYYRGGLGLLIGSSQKAIRDDVW